MAQDFGDTITGFAAEGLPMLIIGAVVIILIVVGIIISVWAYRRKKWNLSFWDSYL
jgi:hypothetical protein